MVSKPLVGLTVHANKPYVAELLREASEFLLDNKNNKFLRNALSMCWANDEGLG